MKETLRIGFDNICPVSKTVCDDETCTPGAECNVSGDSITSGEDEDPYEDKVKFMDRSLQRGTCAIAFLVLFLSNMATFTVLTAERFNEGNYMKGWCILYFLLVDIVALFILLFHSLRKEP